MAELIKSLGRVSGLANYGDLTEWRGATTFLQTIGRRNLKGELDRKEKSIAEICKEVNDTRLSQRRSAREVATNTAVKALATKEGQELFAQAIDAGVSSVLSRMKESGKGALSSMSSSRFFGRRDGENEEEETSTTSTTTSSSQAKKPSSLGNRLKALVKSSSEEQEELVNQYGHPFSSINTRKQASIRRNRRGNPILRQKALTKKQYKNMGVRYVRKRARRSVSVNDPIYGLYPGQFYLPRSAYYQLYPNAIPGSEYGNDNTNEENGGASSSSTGFGKGGRRQTRRRKGRKAQKTRKHA